ncbi:MAG: 2OG-Fe(II) oxygenase [Minisyncoccia bacterium]
MVIKDFIPESFKVFLQNLIESSNFQWYYNKNCTTEGKDGIFQFVHVIANEQGYLSPEYDKIKPLLYFFEMHTGLKVKGIRRMKANLLTQRDLSYDVNFLGTHTDVSLAENDFVSFIYYVNDSDGDTVLYNSDKTEIIERASPKAGSCFWFKSNQFHNATPPKDHQTRIVINCVLQIDNE